MTPQICKRRAAAVPGPGCRTQEDAHGCHVRTIALMPNSVPDAAIPRPDGLVLAPFRALRYACAPEDLAAVVAPPYDVIDDRERAELEGRHEHNVVRLTLPQPDSVGESGYE